MATPRARGAALTSPPPASALEAQLATLVDQAPNGSGWLHEIKLDGYRLLARVDRGAVQLLTRRGNDWTARAPSVARVLGSLPVQNAVLDGELVSLRPDGRSDFQALQNALGDARAEELVYFAFDLLFLDGVDLRAEPLDARKLALSNLLARAKPDPHLRLSDHVVGDGRRFFEQACKLGVEGTIAKRRDAPYRAGRSPDWLKIKRVARQEFVVGGFTPPSGARTHLGALLLGVREGDALRYVGKVGTGFSQESLRALRTRMRPLERKTPPFVDPPRGSAYRVATWVEPVLVAEVAYGELTQDGRLRHPRFLGLRDDKPARDVIRERTSSHKPKRTRTQTPH